jgi:hypothetical protein
VPADGAAPSERPPYNALPIRAVGSIAQISSIELVGSFFAKRDDLPLPAPEPATDPPQVTSQCFWDWDPEARVLGAILRFEASFPGASESDEASLDDRPYFVGADFRAVYVLAQPDDEDPDADALATFAYWNGLLNVWPYWREHVASVLQRARIDSLPIPLFKFPVPAEETARRAEAVERAKAAKQASPGTPTKRTPAKRSTPKGAAPRKTAAITGSATKKAKPPKTSG